MLLPKLEKYESKEKLCWDTDRHVFSGTIYPENFREEVVESKKLTNTSYYVLSKRRYYRFQLFKDLIDRHFADSLEIHIGKSKLAFNYPVQDVEGCDYPMLEDIIAVLDFLNITANKMKINDERLPQIKKIQQDLVTLLKTNTEDKDAVEKIVGSEILAKSRQRTEKYTNKRALLKRRSELREERKEKRRNANAKIKDKFIKLAKGLINSISAEQKKFTEKRREKKNLKKNKNTISMDF